MKKQRACIDCGKIIWSESDLCMKCEKKYKKRVEEIARARDEI